MGIISYRKGFTLIEMAVLLTIVGLLISSFLIPLTSQINAAKIQGTRKTLDEIKQVLIYHAVVNNRLPCSDIDKDGLEDADCMEGDLPWRNLGMGAYRDGWGNAFRYRASQLYTDDIIHQEGSSRLPPTDLAVKIVSGSTSDSGPLIEDVIAIIYSLGKDGETEKNDQLVWIDNIIYAFLLKSINDFLLPVAFAASEEDYSYRCSSKAGVTFNCYKQKPYVPSIAIDKDAAGRSIQDNVMSWISRNELLQYLTTFNRFRQANDVKATPPKVSNESIEHFSVEQLVGLL
jgi:type II secretory pathway pseudopilin PulG